MINQASLSNISHDLRNYISAINGVVNIISECIDSYKKDRTECGKALDKNIEEAMEMAHMLEPYSKEAMEYVEDMMDITQTETGKFTIGHIEACDVEKLISRLVVFNKTFLNKNKVQVQRNIEQNLPRLHCDVRRLKQVLMNLITNSAKYSHENSIIQIDAYSKNERIYIEIADSGVGMNEQELAMALNGRGIEIDKSSLHKPLDSHGLGLPIVKQLMELMGKMEIESQKGKGTKVILEFNAN